MGSRSWLTETNNVENNKRCQTELNISKTNFSVNVYSASSGENGGGTRHSKICSVCYEINIFSLSDLL